MKLLQVVAVAVFVSIVTAQESNVCTEQITCGACIAAGAQCGWCKQEAFERGGLGRCDLVKNLLSKDCDAMQVIKPDHDMEYVQNNPPQDADVDQDAIQLTPQEINVKLRPNKPFTLDVTFKQASNYPVDLYYVMDLSQSMKDDKAKLAELGIKLAEEMSKITKNFRLGFGSFVDKKTMPYVSTVPKDLIEPCNECAPPYSFKNDLPLTEDKNKFSEKVNAAPISGNLDAPEGGFDAIMQSIVCDNNIGWRDGSRKMLLFSTDAGFHYAGDGKLGGIVKPNDGHCHLDGAGMYSESLNQDYPSISQLSHKIKEKNVNIIFAVTENQVDMYKSLKKFIDASEVGTLAEDSSNIVELVRKNYETISSKVKLQHRGADDGDIYVSYKTNCKTGEWEEASHCLDLKIGHNVTFQVSIEAKKCPADRDEWKKSFEIYPVGLTEKLIINYELICECDCELPEVEEPNSPKCNMSGTYECGACTCDPKRYGPQCECDGSDLQSQDYDAACRMTNSTDSPVCEGRGQCLCGQCDCYAISAVEPYKKYDGKFCECDNYSCDRYLGELCGGSERGECVCGKCVCFPPYNGTRCECKQSNVDCIASNGEICNGMGECVCGRCVCNTDSYFRGPTCEDCETCPGRCDPNKACVLCFAFQSGELSAEECRAQCNPLTIVDELQPAGEERKICRFRDDADDCYFRFTYEYADGRVEVQREKECPKPVNLLAIILGVIGAILAIGLILLLLWKLLVTIHDRREFAKFEKERQNAKWDMGENPIYKQATSTFNNPTYGGK